MFVRTHNDPIERQLNTTPGYIGSQNRFETFLRNSGQQDRLLIFENFNKLNRQLTQAHLKRPHAKEGENLAQRQIKLLRSASLRNQQQFEVAPLASDSHDAKSLSNTFSQDAKPTQGTVTSGQRALLREELDGERNEVTFAQVSSIFHRMYRHSANEGPQFPYEKPGLLSEASKDYVLRSTADNRAFAKSRGATKSAYSTQRPPSKIPRSKKSSYKLNSHGPNMLSSKNQPVINVQDSKGKKPVRFSTPSQGQQYA